MIDPEVLLRILLIGYLYGIMSVVSSRTHQTKGFYTQHDFARVPEENAYRCPAGHLLHYIVLSRGSQGFTYRAKPSQCQNCSHKPACTPSSTRHTRRVNWYEDVREQVRQLSQTPEFAFLLAATVQNIKRLVRFINRSKEPESAMT